MGKIKEVQKQDFDFTHDGNNEEVGKWEQALKEIPFPKKNFRLNGLILDEEEKVEVEITATYQYISINDDTWFWLTVLFNLDGTSRVSFLGSYSTNDENRLIPVVNRSLQRMGFDETDDIYSIPEREMATWQEGYDLLCNIARKTKVPKFEK